MAPSNDAVRERMEQLRREGRGWDCPACLTRNGRLRTTCRRCKKEKPHD